MDGWIGVDLDGTLAHLGGYKGMDFIGSPITVMVNRVKRWLELGIRVKILTARVADDPDGHNKKVIEAYLKQHVGQVLEITCQKDMNMFELWDDRCVQVVKNTGLRVGEERRIHTREAAAR
ncbi:MAG: hypothetical protein KOO63_07975 [Bacteroidales bacterium]|nr:hypothetical protein [Candidatus Latescibacterota bacterium]